MNPFLHKLGYTSTDRVVVLHADDIGMCHATLLALDGLLDAGLITKTIDIESVVEVVKP